MTLKQRCAAAVLVVCVAIPAGAQEEAASSFAEAVRNGDTGISFRYRYEFVDQDGFASDANASTARLRLNYRTATFRNFSLFGEFDYVGELFADNFNSLGGSSPSRDRYPVVADPRGPDLNQLYLDYAAAPGVRFRVGRQRILLDNQRFVGAVGWRQNEQTYDALTVKVTQFQDVELHYTYIDTVRRIFGNDVPAGRNDTHTHLLNAKFGLRDGWSITPYYYYIDNEDVAAFSTATVGARLTGAVKAGDGRLELAGELATQSDAANNPVNYDAEYYHFGANWILGEGLSLGVDWMSLGGSQAVAGASFRTPMATLHGFQGWADRFLATPDAGVEDLYVTAKYRLGNWDLTGIFHDFSAASGGADWGTEIDLSAGRRFADRYQLLLKAAFYDADQFATDTTKLWVMVSGSY